MTIIIKKICKKGNIYYYYINGKIKTIKKDGFIAWLTKRIFNSNINTALQKKLDQKEKELALTEKESQDKKAKNQKINLVLNAFESEASVACIILGGPCCC